MTLSTPIREFFLSGKRHRKSIFSLSSPISNPRQRTTHLLLHIHLRWLATSAETHHPEFSTAENAYEVLGVSETCSFDEIKASFRKLAKETHPDLVSSSDDDSTKHFVEILAAYEILSDSSKRAHYDQYLLTTRHIMQTHLKHDSGYHMYATNVSTAKQMEVVEWLRWYRYAVKDILSNRKLPAGTGYFDVLQRELYSAMRSAYFGPEIHSLDLLPDRFEAEERSVCETPDVLHLVSGRDHFGIVRIADYVPEISDVSYKKLASENSNSKLCPSFENVDHLTDNANECTADFSTKNVECIKLKASDAYKNLELHVCGRLVAKATRIFPKDLFGETEDESSQDQIHVFLDSQEELTHFNYWFSKERSPYDSGSKKLVGRITGLGTSPDESSCNVYNGSGAKSHVVLKHRTPLVKHMHWFQLRDEVSFCECRCTRARLPPSKYWLFEPRCSMHDVGGWYIETYGRDKNNRTITSQRHWDSINVPQQFEKRLHPAVYLFALAYRTLDIENSRRLKPTIRDVAQGNLLKIFNWCKKLV